MKNFYLILMTLCFMGGMLLSANAADMSIDMLNKQGKEKMLYSVNVAEVDVGDTITWQPKDKDRKSVV